MNLDGVRDLERTTWAVSLFFILLTNYFCFRQIKGYLKCAKCVVLLQLSVRKEYVLNGCV